MAISRRDAICSISGATLAGLSLDGLIPEALQAHAPQAPQAQEAWPDRLVERPLRQGFPAPLPLNPDGSAPEHPESAAGPITDPLMWRTPNRQAPEIEFDYRKMAIKVDTRGLAKLTGTLRFEDLEKLPRRLPHLSHAVWCPESPRDREMDRRPLQRFRRHAGPRPRRALLPADRVRPPLRRRAADDACGIRR